LRLLVSIVNQEIPHETSWKNCTEGQVWTLLRSL
jgi:hypothetical protein